MTSCHRPARVQPYERPAKIRIDRDAVEVPVQRREVLHNRHVAVDADRDLTFAVDDVDVRVP